jgi:tRNA pseudouridine55 synthase
VTPAGPPALGGLLVVDKPSGMTSHAVVARVRKLANTRRVGHAGTLDPMATGVLVIGIGRATRLLGHLALRDKDYRATIRLGRSTVTDDAEGELVQAVPAGEVTDAQIAAAVEVLTGAILQVPSKISALKIDGVRSYARVRSGEDVQHAPRPVVVSRFDVIDVRRDLVDDDDVVDVDVEVSCSTGTYVRALARDLGEALGVGGHLTALRRTRVGPFGIDEAHLLDEALEVESALLPLGQAMDRGFAQVVVDEATADLVLHGRRLPADLAPPGEGPFAVFGPAQAPLALMEPRAGELVPLVVFA